MRVTVALAAILIALAPPATSGAGQGSSAAGPLDASRPIAYRITEGAPDTGFRDGDRELARWTQRCARSS